MRYGMVIDLLRCQGCRACAVACKIEHGLPPEVFLSNVILRELGEFPDGRMVWLPVACAHCGQADCLEVCPTEATYRTEEGLVLVDTDKCIGCGACLTACTFGSRSLVRESKNYFPDGSATPYEQTNQKQNRPGLVVKCDFCVDRLDKGQQPACVTTCPAQARTFGDLDDPDSPVGRLLKNFRAESLPSETDNQPALFYIR